MPKFAHLPLLLKPDGKGKLSKRDGDRLGFRFSSRMARPEDGEVSSGYREAASAGGCHQFPGLVGLESGNRPGNHVVGRTGGAFDITKCSKAGAKFDYVKGLWFNREYILMKDNKELAPLSTRYCARMG